MLKLNTPSQKIIACGMASILQYSQTIKVYKGTMPSSANSYTAASRSSDLLLSWSATGNPWSLDSGKTKVYMSTFPSAVAASASGTATWFVVDCSSLSGNYPYLIDTVSDINGNSVMKILTTTIVSGTSYDIYSLAFEIKQ